MTNNEPFSFSTNFGLAPGHSRAYKRDKTTENYTAEDRWFYHLDNWIRRKLKHLIPTKPSPSRHIEPGSGRAALFPGGGLDPQPDAPGGHLPGELERHWVESGVITESGCR